MCQEYSVYRGVCLPHCILGYTPFWANNPSRQTLPRQTPPSRQTSPLGRHLPGRHPRADTPPRQTPSPLRWPLQQTVRILLECILVIFLEMHRIQKRFSTLLINCCSTLYLPVCQICFLKVQTLRKCNEIIGLCSSSLFWIYSVLKHVPIGHLFNFKPYKI